MLNTIIRFFCIISYVTGASALIATNGSTQWPNPVPYTCDPKQNKDLGRYLVPLSNRTGLKFVSRTNEAEWIHFELNSSAPRNEAKFVGRKPGGGAHRLVIRDYGRYAILNGLFHALGFRHEHQRKDRMQYINVFTERVTADYAKDYGTIDDAEILTPYDDLSIMHYSSSDGANVDAGHNVTMTYKNGTAIRLQDTLSYYDVEGLCTHYGLRSCYLTGLPKTNLMAEVPVSPPPPPPPAPTGLGAFVGLIIKSFLGLFKGEK
jgi:hypothetical protein